MARPKQVRFLSACLALTMRSAVFSAAASAAVASSPPPPGPADAARATRPCRDSRLVPTPRNLHRVRKATLCLINQQRAAHGLASLRENASLHARAQRHTAQMVIADYFADDRLTAAPGRAIGENVAVGSGALTTPAAMVAAWMDSPEHRANILNAAFKRTGLGAVAAAPAMLGFAGTVATYTQYFASGR